MPVVEHWIRKFRNAFRGVVAGMEGQSSFVVHIPVAIAVLILAFVLHCSIKEWQTLLLCIGAVLSAELFNSAIESLAKGLCKEHNPEVGRALDIASGAVLVISFVAVIVGLLIFIPRLIVVFNL